MLICLYHWAVMGDPCRTHLGNPIWDPCGALLHSPYGGTHICMSHENQTFAVHRETMPTQ